MRSIQLPIFPPGAATYNAPVAFSWFFVFPPISAPIFVYIKEKGRGSAPTLGSALADARVFHHATRRLFDMGDKNPKAQQKAKKQEATKNSDAKDAHDRKQAAPAPTGKGKGK